MFEVRFHGRGGQGVVSAAEMLSVAAFMRGKYSQAFPSFGSERMGAPVMSFCRIDDAPIRSREPVVQPNCLIVQDPTLLGGNVLDGLRTSGYLLVNSAETMHGLGLDDIVKSLPPAHCCTVPATEIAMEYAGRPAPNVVLLGAFVALTSVVDIEALEQAIRLKFRGDVAEKNIAAARVAYEFVNRAESREREAVRC